MMSSLSKRLMAGLAAGAVGVTMTACGGGGDTASGDFDGQIKVGVGQDDGWVLRLQAQHLPHPIGLGVLRNQGVA